MTTGTSLDDGPAGRRWAAGLLGVGEDAPRAEVRRAYLEKLREADFEPSRSLRNALRLLEGKAVPGGADADRLLEEETRLRAEVESFADEFFAIPAGERRRRWDGLVAGCRGVPPLAARLRALRAGLEVETAGLPADLSFPGRLVEHLIHAFPQSPLAQATSRQAFLRQIEDPSAEAERPAWEKAARYLLAEWPALASLDGELVRHVAELRSRLARRVKLSRRARQKPPEVPAGEKQSTPWWILWVACGVVGAIVRDCAKTDNPTPPRAPLIDPNRLAGDETPVVPNLAGHPSLDALCDPAKFDVEILNSGTSRIWRFTPRPGARIAGHDGRPLVYGEAILRLRGITPSQLQSLTFHAERGKARKAREADSVEELKALRDRANELLRPDRAPEAPPAEKTPP